jgi:hypothetical protein
MSFNSSSSPRRKRARLALAAALVAVGCSGGAPFKFTGTRLDNVAQVRLTRSGFNFLSASHLNDILAALNPGTLAIPCSDVPIKANTCFLGNTLGTKFEALIGDNNFSGACEQSERTPVQLQFKSVTWQLEPASQALHVALVVHVKTGDIFVRTKEEHSTLCGGTSPIQAHVWYDDEDPALLLGNPPDTTLDLDLQFTTAPDGRLEVNLSQESLTRTLAAFTPSALGIDGAAAGVAATYLTGNFYGNGCDASVNGSYSTVKSDGTLRCSGIFDSDAVNLIRGLVLDQLKTVFQTQIAQVIRSQFDNLRCQRSSDSQGKAVACDANHLCPADDDGALLKCDAARGVCFPPAQSDPPANFNCEPVALAIAGQLDVSQLTSKVGFPPDTKLDFFAGLGSKTGGASVDTNGLQLAAQAGTSPASNILSLCVPPALPGPAVNPPPMDFEAGANKPSGVSSYDAGFSLASAMLNRGFLDAYSAGLLCVAVTNKTTSFISSGLFKTFLPSLGLVSGGKDVPMMILLRPSQPPHVRIGRNTTKTNPDGTTSPDDPLLTLTFKQLNLDFYALVDERQVRLFTLQADMQLPLGMRTFADPNTDTLQPVLGSLDTLLTNISALSPDGGAYGPSDMLAEDPGVVKDLLGAAVRLAQPLLAGLIKPMVLPTMLGLRFGIDGVAGAEPMADVVKDGYHHLAIWAKVNECGTSCEQYTVRTEVRAAGSFLPDSVKDVRAGRYPSLDLDLSARQARSGARAEFSYRVDGSLWSPWIGNVSRLTLRDPLFLVQGHHIVEVTSREAGDDHTMDPQPAVVDFFVSYEAPTVSLAQRPDGAVVTRAHSAASNDEALFFSYRIDGEQSWTRPGPARIFTLDELRGRGLNVSVSDEAGRAALAHFGDDDAPDLIRAGIAGGCGTTSGAPAWALLPLFFVLLLHRQRKGSSSRG